ncbi:MAG: hypothetical protein ABIH03_12950 [Pseudomonadota bacterium]
MTLDCGHPDECATIAQGGRLICDWCWEVQALKAEIERLRTVVERFRIAWESERDERVRLANELCDILESQGIAE